MTIRDLAKYSGETYSQDWWLQLARACGLDLGPDDELTREQQMKLRAKFDEKCAPGRKKQEKTDADKREAAMRLLDQYVKERCIFVDLSSILAPAAEEAMRNILPLLTRYGRRLFIPQSVMRELKLLAADTSDPERAQMCRKREAFIMHLLKHGLAQIRMFKDPQSTPAQDLLTACSHFRMTYPLLVMTQDERLAADLLSLNGQQSAQGENILVKRINKYGFLSSLNEVHRENTKRFRLYTTPRAGQDKQLGVTQTPRAGEYAYHSPDGKGAILLKEEIGGGGEGTIYSTDVVINNGSEEVAYVAKIYKPECCTEYRREKIVKMIQAGLSYKGICFPTSILYNRNGEFVGYMMMEAKGHPVQNSIFRKPLFAKKLPGWEKKELVLFAITVLHKIRYLHGKNILIGDINANNILVVSPLEVYFVDTDSYQIDDLPCPVGMPQFTAPEIHQMSKSGVLKDFSQIMRTKESEYFAIATMLFMLMLPGKLPYAHAGGENIVDNIIHMHFPYALGERRSMKVPDGSWRYSWSHLSRRMKDCFDLVFTKGENKSEFNIKERLDVDQWITEMTEYYRVLLEWERLLEEGKPKIQAYEREISLQEQRGIDTKALKRELKEYLASLPDSMSLKIYPTRPKRQRDKVYVTCRGQDCTKEYPEDADQLKAGFCPECQRKGETVKCQICDEEFVFSNYEKYFKGFKRPNMCPDCRKGKDNIVEEYQCATPGCFQMVQVTQARKAYCKSNNKQLPKYCNACYERSKKSGARPMQQAARPAASRPEPTRPAARPVEQKRELPTKGSGLQGCFITTAVCGYLGKPDDCQELMDFRAFRDNWLRHQPGGEEQIREYYECAPELVRRMNASADYAGICTALWEDYLIPCQKMIHEGRMEHCRAHYAAMVDYLRKTLEV